MSNLTPFPFLPVGVTVTCFWNSFRNKYFAPQLAIYRDSDLYTFVFSNYYQVTHTPYTVMLPSAKYFQLLPTS